MSILSSDRGWIVETRSAAYALGVDGEGRLCHRYWGARLPDPADYPPVAPGRPWAAFNPPSQLAREEYPAEGEGKFIEPCLKLAFADGTRDLRLRFDGAEAGGDELVVQLRDERYPLRVTLRYAASSAHDLVERRATIANEGDAPVTVERAWSACWHLPRGDGYRLTHLTGRWFDEARIRRDPLAHGVTALESRRITSSHHHAPWFALDRGDADAPVGEEHGEVWFGALAWSGNWKLAAEVTDFQSTRVGVGVNDWDFAWVLGPGESFEAPPCVAGYTTAGFGGASRLLHDYVRDVLLDGGQAPRKLIYNSWEATLFDVDAASQIALAEIAAAMGVEVFVVDDGWFHRREDDRAALGDWWADERKFPAGLGPLVERVNALGMDFGLWIEPEGINPESELYRARPDWIIRFQGREPTLARNQLILNLARGDVQDHLIERFDRLLGDHNIAYVKWDMNRNVSEPGWPEAPGEPRELWVRYVQGLYRVWGALAERHPKVTWLSCSGGGGRADLGILRYADRVQISDNTDATAVIGIQEGFARYLPAAALETWVADAAAARLPLSFRFHAAMCGVMVLGGHLARWSLAERARAGELIARYKVVRHIVHLGDRYQLRSAQGSPFSAVQFVSKDRAEGALFAFRTYLPDPVDLPALRLRGLDPDARYAVEGFPDVRSGAAWMHAGLELPLGNFESTLRQIRRV